MKTTAVNGSKLRALLYATGINQKSLANKVGVTHYNVNRWCQRGDHAIRTDNVQRIAALLGLTVEELLRQVGPQHASKVSVEAVSDLTPAEAAVVAMFRGLTPLDQAKALLAIEGLREKESQG